MIILGNDGVIEKAARLNGLVTDMPSLLFTNGAMLVGMVCSCVPLMVLPVFASIEKLEPALIEASHDLYGTRWATARRVILPLTLPGVASGAMLAFFISMDDFITSSMLNSGGATTLPVYIFSLVRNGTTPELNAISAMVTAVSLGLAGVALALSFKSQKPA